MRYRFALLASCLSLCSCATTATAEGRAQLSSGHIGCLPEEITTTKPTSTAILTENWVATCRGKQFVCSSTQGEYGPEVACAPQVP